MKSFIVSDELFELAVAKLQDKMARKPDEVRKLEINWGAPIVYESIGHISKKLITVRIHEWKIVITPGERFRMQVFHRKDRAPKRPLRLLVISRYLEDYEDFTIEMLPVLADEAQALLDVGEVSVLNRKDVRDKRFGDDEQDPFAAGASAKRRRDFSDSDEGDSDSM